MGSQTWDVSFALPVQDTSVHSLEAALSRPHTPRIAGIWPVLFVALTLSSGCDGGDDSTPAVMINEEWEAIAEDFEADGVASENDPGDHDDPDLVKVHLPHIKLGSTRTYATITTMQLQRDDHVVEAQYIRDQDGIVVGYHEVASDARRVESGFDLPDGTTSIVAYQYCSRHGAWKSAPQSTAAR